MACLLVAESYAAMLHMRILTHTLMYTIVKVWVVVGGDAMRMPIHHDSSNDAVLLTEEQRQQQTQMIMQLFEHWQLTNAECAILLGLSPNTATSINNYNTGKSSLPKYRDIQDRVGHLFAIHRYLKQAYPFNEDLAYRWIKSPNADFQGFTPLQIINKEGFEGLLRVRYYLESNME